MESVVLTITMTPDGQIHVTGPIENRLLCYGLLGIARELVQKHAESQERLIQPATLAMVPKRDN